MKRLLVFHIPTRLTAIAMMASPVFLVPSKFQTYDFRHIRRSIEVKISKSSPPLAALEDESLTPLLLEPAEMTTVDAGQVRLNAGTHLFNWNKVFAHARPSRPIIETHEAEVRLTQVESKKKFRTPVRTFAGLVITRHDVDVQVADQNLRISHSVNKPDARVEQKFDVRARAMALANGYSPKTADTTAATGFLAQLPPHLRKRAEKLNNLNELMNKDWSQPGLAEQIQKLAANQEESAQQPAPATQRMSDALLAVNEKRAPSLPAVQSNGKQYLVTGHIEMVGGLAYMGQEQSLTVSHQTSGETRSVGKVSIPNGTFKIEVEDTSVGTLVAELRSADGRLIGRGEAPIASASNANTDEYTIQLRPLTRTTRGRASHAGTDHSGAIQSARVDFVGLGLSATTSTKGTFTKNGLSGGSTFMIRTHKPGYVDSVSIASTDDNIPVSLYSEGMVKGLADFLNEKSDLKKFGLIWGQVMVDGKPLEGAQVHVDDPEVRGPIYFNGLFLPELKADRTSKNGYFAFLRVKPGSAVVTASYNGAEMPAHLVPIRANSVTRVDFTNLRKKQADAYVFNALTGAPLNSQIRFTGSQKSSWTDGGRIRLRFRDGAEPLFLESDAGPSYFPGRITASRNATSLNLPMIPFEWLNGLRREMEVPIGVQESTVVGFIQGKSFAVYLDSADATAETRLAYLDPQGQIIANAKKGVPGGGFVLFNVPPGFRTVMIQPEGEDALLAKLVYVDATTASVISHQFND